MMTTEPEADPWQHPSVRGYWIVCLASLLAVTVALLFRNLETWSLLPILVGSLGLALRWRAGPLLTLATLGWVLHAERIGLSPLDQVEYLFVALLHLLAGRRIPYAPVRLDLGLAGQPVLWDLLLGAGVLAYSAAHCRLLGLADRIFPTDRRPKPGRPPGSRRLHEIEPRRSEQTVTPWEVGRLLMCVAGWVALAVLVWSWLSQQRPPLLAWPSPIWRAIYPELAPAGDRLDLRLAPAVWQGMLLAWLVGLGAIAAAAVIGYLGLRRMSPREAALYLQDTLWRETCREQRLLNRWLARARLRSRRKERSG